MFKLVVVLVLSVGCLAIRFDDFDEFQQPQALEEDQANQVERQQDLDETQQFDETLEFDERALTEELFDENKEIDKDEELDEEDELDEFDVASEDAAIDSHVKYLDTTRAALLKFAKDLRKGRNITNAFLKVIDGFEKRIADYQAALGRRRLSPELVKSIQGFIKEAIKDRKGNTKVLQALTSEGIFLAEKTGGGVRVKRDDSELLQGALAFLESIKEDIGDTAFEDYLSVSGLVTLMFVVDDTGSMSDDIKAVTAIATQIVNHPRDYEVDYILSPFNDPTTGPITVKNETQGEEFVKALEKLKAHGGLDCPELAIKGMIDALESGPQPGSSMYIFTDASPKDATKENVSHLLDLAHDQDVYINFFTKDSCGDSEGEKVYEEIAKETKGLVYPLKSSDEIRELGSLISDSLGGATSVGSGGSGPTAGRRKRALGSEYSISVDDSVDKIFVTVTTKNSGAGITLLDPSGKSVTDGRTDLAKGTVYEIAHPTTGIYKLIIPASAGEHKYKVSAVSGRNIDFGYYYAFIPKRGRKPVPVPLEQPLQGLPVTVFLTLAGADLVKTGSLSVKIVDKAGKVLANKPVTKAGTSGVRYFAKFDPPSGSFKLELHGQTKKGNAFVRTSPREDHSIPVILRLSYKPDSNILFRSKTTRFRIQIRRGNVGDPLQSYTIAMKDQRGYGKVSKQPRAVRAGRFGFASIEFTVPDDAPKAKTERIQIHLTKKGKSKVIASLSFSLLIV